MSLNRRAMLYLGGAALAATAAGCARGQNSNAYQLLLDWSLEPNYTGFLLAKEKGFFQAQGVDVSLEEGSGVEIVAQTVGAGNKEVICSSSGSGAVTARGAGIPVKSLGVIFPNISTAIFSMTAKPIRTPADLIGKKIGLVSGSVTVEQYKAMLQTAGIDRSRITEIGVNPDPSPLLTGHVDALIDYEEQLPASLLAKNTPITVMPLSDFGVHQYGLNIIANERALADATRGPQLHAIARAAFQGYDYLRSHVDEAINLYMTKYPQKDRGYAELSIKKTAQLLGSGVVGAQTVEGWNATLDSLRSVHLVTDTVTAADIMA